MLTANPWRQARPVAKRTRQVARVLAVHGLETLVHQAGLRPFAPRWPGRPAVNGAPRTQAQRLRQALGELGTTFIKLGQMLSTRADLLPPDVAAELGMLTDAAPAVAIADIERVIAEDLGQSPERVFASFDTVPLASASIGQVHGATLADGQQVVVKVRRPGVVEQVEVDLQIVRGMVGWVQEHTPFGQDVDLRPVVDELSQTLRDELDYVREARNATRFRRAFLDDATVIIPRVVEPFSTQRVLTLERVSGVKISDLATLDRLGIPRRRIAENAVRFFLRQVLEFGFFHADPHAGNFFVQPDASLAVVDFGMVGRVSEPVQEHLLRAGLAAMQEDAESLAEELYALGIAGRRVRRAGFQKDLDHLVSHYGGHSVKELSARAVVADLLAIISRHHLQLPGELALLLRVLNMSEGIGLSLDPDFRYLEFAAPRFRRAWAARHSLRANVARLGRSVAEGAELGLGMPRRLEHLLGRIERGEIQFSVQHEGLESLTRELQRMTNRLALSVILAASVVALGLGVAVGHSPGLDPVVAWMFKLGLAFSLGFGLWVVWGIWRAGHARR